MCSTPRQPSEPEPAPIAAAVAASENAHGWETVPLKKGLRRKRRQKKKKTAEALKQDVAEAHQLMMRSYKTEKCQTEGHHDYQACEFWHHADGTDRRRDPRVHEPELCLDKTCNLGDACGFAHNKLEMIYHPQLYKTKACGDQNCTRGKLCAFAHGDLREYTPFIAPLHADTGTSPRSKAKVSDHLFLGSPKLVLHQATVQKLDVEFPVSTNVDLPSVCCQLLEKTSIQSDIKSVCLKIGCIKCEYVKSGNPHRPYEVYFSGRTQEQLDRASDKVRAYFDSDKIPKTHVPLPPLFLRFLEQADGRQFLLEKSKKIKKRDILISFGANEAVLWCSSTKDRLEVQHFLKEEAKTRQFTDMQLIAQARIMSLEDDNKRLTCKLQRSLQKLKSQTERMTEATQDLQQLKTHADETTQVDTAFPAKWKQNVDGSHDAQNEVPQPSEEYDFVFTRFVASLTTVPVIHRILRIQAPRLWAHYSLHKVHIANEMWLFHGTQPASVDKIIAEGFNRSFAGYNATAFGEGCYFAKNSHYSMAYTSRRKRDSHRFMFLARTLVGTFAKGEKGMKTSPRGFDSVVNKILRPEIHIVFQDQQAYPAYIIEFSC
jgi:hypothetical protein